MRLLSVFLSFALIFAPFSVYAHSGGTDSSGCHTDSSTGTRHCHNSGGFTGGSDSASEPSEVDWGLIGGFALIFAGLGATIGGGAVLARWGATSTDKAIGVSVIVLGLGMMAGGIAILVANGSEEQTPTAGVTLFSW